MRVFSISASKLYCRPRSPNQGFLLKDIPESETKMVLPQKEGMGRNGDLCGEWTMRHREGNQRTTKVHIVKAMGFPVVTYGCESWTVKKAECQRIDAFELWC